MPSAEILAAESEIDTAFADNELARLPFAQSAWTLLSVTEDHHFNIAVVSPLEAHQAAIFVDVLMNSLTYPLRVCHSVGEKGSHAFAREFVDHHYELAYRWLERAEDYAHFNTMFPLYRAGKIELKVNGTDLVPTDWSKTDLSYEVYDRFVAKRDPESEAGLNPNLVRKELVASIRTSGAFYSVDFTKRLLQHLEAAFVPILTRRHALPENWHFANFSIQQYRAVFTCLQSMAYAWFAARQIVAAGGAPEMAYPSAVWTPRKGLLVSIIARHTGLPSQVVAVVLKYLTFGEVGVRRPDIAIQPIMDLSNDQYAIAPFVLKNVNAERNLCVLLNQIPEERRLYSQLVDEKELRAREETIESIGGLNLEFRHGSLDSTDLDLAIIDRQNRVCLCIEIKWFIEPAEVREIHSRSEELTKGVTQALKLAELFANQDDLLLRLLDIDSSYEFQSMVGSVNFIGSHYVQDSRVPITKLWHVAAQVRADANLAKTLNWLRQREYLPKKDIDYKITEVPITSGNWRSRWYGIEYA